MRYCKVEVLKRYSTVHIIISFIATYALQNSWTVPRKPVGTQVTAVVSAGFLIDRFVYINVAMHLQASATKNNFAAGQRVNTGRWACARPPESLNLDCGLSTVSQRSCIQRHQVRCRVIALQKRGGGTFLRNEIVGHIRAEHQVKKVHSHRECSDWYKRDCLRA